MSLEILSSLTGRVNSLNQPGQTPRPERENYTKEISSELPETRGTEEIEPVPPSKETQVELNSGVAPKLVEIRT